MSESGKYPDPVEAVAIALRPLIISRRAAAPESAARSALKALTEIGMLNDLYFEAIRAKSQQENDKR